MNAFADFMLMEPERIASGPTEVINEMQARSYVIDSLFAGRDERDMIRGGPTCKDFVIFDRPSTAVEYDPNDDHNWQNPQFVREHEQAWKFLLDHMACTEHELGKALGSDYPSDTQTEEAFKSLRHTKESGFKLSIVNALEAQIWCSPFGNQAAMSDGGRKPISIPAWATELPTGLPVGWTSGSVGGFNPVVDPKWRGNISHYDPTLAFKPTTAAGAGKFVTGTFASGNPYTPVSPDTGIQVNDLFGAFDDMHSKMNFRVSPMISGAITVREDRQKIWTDREGKKNWQAALRASNDTLAVSRQDPAYNYPRSSGIPVVDIEALNNAAIYPAHSAAVDQRLTGGSADILDITAVSAVQTHSHPNTIVQGPRYFFLNLNHLGPKINGGKFMQRMPVIVPERKPHARIFPVDTWWLLWCESRRRSCGVIAPFRIA